MRWTPKCIPRRTYRAVRVETVLDEYNIPSKVSTEFLVENSSAPQPVTEEDNIPVPEGLYDAEIYKIFTTTPLRGVLGGTASQSDRLLINDTEYIVMQSKIWSADVQSHYEVYISKAQEPEIQWT